MDNNTTTCTRQETPVYEDTCQETTNLEIGKASLKLLCSLPNRHGGKHEYKWDENVVISWK
jgi:hypothetical protein